MTPQDDFDKRLQPAPIPGQQSDLPLPPPHLKPLPFFRPVSNTTHKTSILALTYLDYYILRASREPLPLGSIVKEEFSDGTFVPAKESDITRPGQGVPDPH